MEVKVATMCGLTPLGDLQARGVSDGKRYETGLSWLSGEDEEDGAHALLKD